MAWIVCVDTDTFVQAIGPFAKEAEADKRAEAEALARAPGKVHVAFLVQPDWVEPGARWTVPFEFVLQRDGEIVTHRPYGNDPLSGRPPDLDDL
jgi:hypothetical protein